MWLDFQTPATGAECPAPVRNPRAPIEGAPARNQTAMSTSKIVHPNVIDDEKRRRAVRTRPVVGCLSSRGTSR